jgi:hypothetical protein
MNITVTATKPTVWDEKSINYSDKMEQMNKEYIKFLFNKMFINSYNKIIELERFSEIDFLFENFYYEDKSIKKGIIESKIRSISYDQYPSILIEEDKYRKLWENEYSKDYPISLYINFLENSKEKVWICNIKDIKKNEYMLEYKENMRIKIRSLGSRYTYYEDRILIPRELGKYYEFKKDLNKYILIN